MTNTMSFTTSIVQSVWKSKCYTYQFDHTQKVWFESDFRLKYYYNLQHCDIRSNSHTCVATYNQLHYTMKYSKHSHVRIYVF